MQNVSLVAWKKFGDLENPDDNVELPTTLEILDNEVIFTSASPITETGGFFHVSLLIQ